MTSGELRAAAARLVASRAEQGLGERVQDRATLAKVAALIGGEVPPERQRGRRTPRRAGV
jgi:hypothetical protein